MNNKGCWFSYILFFGVCLVGNVFLFFINGRGGTGVIRVRLPPENYFFNIVSSAFSYFVIFFPFSCEIWLVARPIILFRPTPLHHSLSSSHFIVIITTTTIISYNNNDIILSSPSIYSTSSSTSSSLHFSLLLHLSLSRSTQCRGYDDPQRVA